MLPLPLLLGEAERSAPERSALRSEGSWDPLQLAVWLLLWTGSSR